MEMMRTSEGTSKIAAALVAAQAAAKLVPKSGSNNHDGYKYSNLKDYIAAAHGAMADNGLALLVSSFSAEGGERTTRNGGKEYRAHVSLVGRLWHSSGEWMEFAACGEGQDRADKAVYKGITGARKYMLAGLLNLATSDDPEGDETVGETAPAAPRARKAASPVVPAEATPRDQLIAAVRKWTGIKDPGDMAEVMRGIKTACGVKSEKATDADLALMLAFVTGNIDKKTNFAEVLK